MIRVKDAEPPCLSTPTSWFKHVPSAPFHAQARRTLETDLRGGEPLRESRQVLREYLAVVTRPQTWVVPLPVAETLADLERLGRNYAILEDGPAVTRELAALCRAVPLGGRQVHGANIVAAMLAHGERRLLTFNLADFARFLPRIELVAP